ncbi:MAG: dihydrofolate reductase [Atopobiaceae bacterium]|jgi:dihydrofolate reductase|nr:dihydrofolate reductase [Atopobiaceae bacterium]
MNAIVAITKDWGIGRDGSLLVRNKADMARFARLTTGGIVIMGRLTLESFPGAKPLKNRRNIVLSHDDGLVVDGAEVVSGTGELLRLLEHKDQSRIWVIGGESVYRQLLPYCDRVYLTLNETLLPADARFPELDKDPEWKVAKREAGGITADGVSFEFVTYERVSEGNAPSSK